jgi:Tol biopolymer transport system component
VADDLNGEWDIFVHDQQTGQTSRVSVSSDGNEANGSSGSPAISTDGRYVAFSSKASDLVADDFNGKSDIFVHDRQSGQTTRVSVDSKGNEAATSALYSAVATAISADGRYVAFSADAYNLVADDTNRSRDIFVHKKG